ncbi:hypothetical protein AiwAL_18630, partial [Acidiphilium sp. AL]|uniref:hypothetical protein n=1 Tax=Acidiphilium sp. AL TaxID=2871704 RepID=UPI0021CB24D6
PQALLTMLYRSTDRRCRRGATMKNLDHSASFHLLENIAPLKSGIKHIARRPVSQDRFISSYFIVGSS